MPPLASPLLEVMCLIVGVFVTRNVPVTGSVPVIGNVPFMGDIKSIAMLLVAT